MAAALARVLGRSRMLRAAAAADQEGLRVSRGHIRGLRRILMGRRRHHHLTAAPLGQVVAISNMAVPLHRTGPGNMVTATSPRVIRHHPINNTPRLLHARSPRLLLHHRPENLLHPHRNQRSKNRRRRNLSRRNPSRRRRRQRAHGRGPVISTRDHGSVLARRPGRRRRNARPKKPSRNVERRRQRG